MTSCKDILEGLSAHTYDASITHFYCCSTESQLSAQRARIADAVKGYQRVFITLDDTSIFIASGPGRTELGGNHTDHQHGRVLAASVNMDMLAVVSPNGTNFVCAQSEGYPTIKVDVTALAPVRHEEGTSTALIRGVVAQMAAAGHSLGGFNAYVVSSIPPGSGLSSSAAYEVLMGVVFNHLFCSDTFDAVCIAQIGQISENKFVGKPCGLMDQMASAVGGIVAIDFQDPQHPLVEKVDFDFAAMGFALCIIDSGADHADLTDEYAAITREMCGVAAAFGKSVLRDVPESDFNAHIPELRRTLGDRAILRAIHFYSDNRRAKEEADALKQGDFEGFLRLIRASGISSALHLQNTWATPNPRQQAIPLALALAEEVLDGWGDSRVHGGFAGRIQAYVPYDLLPEFTARMENLLGANMCHVLSIRPEGGCTLID